jgi:hypothetical protein
MQGADKGQAGRLDGHDLRVGIVQARFNDELTSRMAALCIEELTALGVQAKHIQHVTVSTFFSSLFCPSSVPIHYDGHVLWYPSFVYLFYIGHLFILNVYVFLLTGIFRIQIKP